MGEDDGDRRNSDREVGKYSVRSG